MRDPGEKHAVVTGEPAASKGCTAGSGRGPLEKGPLSGNLASGLPVLLYGQSDEVWRVRVEWFREGASLKVEVHNAGYPARVRLRRPDAADAHGRGLLLVDSIADSWHCGPSRFGGTVVSFVMADAWPS